MQQFCSLFTFYHLRFGFKNYKDNARAQYFNISVLNQNYQVLLMNWEREQLKKRLIESLKNKSNFGYKILNQQDLGLIKEWYNYPDSIKLSEDQIKCFGSKQLVYPFHLLAFTKAKEGIMVSPWSNFIKNIIKREGRVLLEIKTSSCMVEAQQETILNSIKDNIGKCKMVIWSNPDLETGRSWSKKFLANIIGLCKSNQVFLLIDQSLSDFYDHFPSGFNYQYENLVVIKQVGRTLTDNRSVLKAIALYKTPEVLRKADKQMKYIKMLAGDLLIELVRIGMGYQAKKYKNKVIEAIKVNYELMAEFLKEINGTGIYEKGSQVLIMENRRQRKMEVLIKIMELTKVEIQCDRQFFKMSLNQDTQLLKSKIKSLKKLMPLSKL